ncbi:MAG: metal-binding protein [Betaproteobacteria bacterium RIFCSPLOWO2_12_FULL_62_13b]|nr:MAG: metal-binding protein [Betaproteobacteria bacterium RIFCSPLOWO2_12_FULL_62_13b]
MKRLTAILATAILGLSVSMAALAQQTVVEVYKSPTCGCCTDRIKHLQQNGFTVKAHDVGDASAYRAKFGVPDQLGSCHTATAGGYAIEGHVPAREIKRLLLEKPKAKGLAVPTMPMGSPGMEGPRSDPYEVLLFQANGKYAVYQKYGK